MKSSKNISNELVTRSVLRTEVKSILREEVPNMVRETIREEVPKMIKDQLDPFYKLLNTTMKDIQVFNEENTILRSLHSRVLDLEDRADVMDKIHPEGKHSTTN